MDSKLAQLLVLAALCACVQLAHSELVVNVPSVKVELKKSEDEDYLGPKYFLPKQTTISIKCNVNSTNALNKPSVTWKNNGTDVVISGRVEASGQLSEDKKMYISTLTIKRATSMDITKYTCDFKHEGGTETLQETGSVESLPLIDMKVEGIKRLDVSVSAGDTITVLCDVPNSNGQLTFIKPNQERISSNGSLTMSDLSYDTDRGILQCSATNGIGNNTARLYLRVKSPTAFLVPLIILIVEIIVISVIVAVSEFLRRKRQQEMLKED